MSACGRVGLSAGSPRRGSSGVQREEDHPAVLTADRRRRAVHLATVERDGVEPPRLFPVTVELIRLTQASKLQGAEQAVNRPTVSLGDDNLKKDGRCDVISLYENDLSCCSVEIDVGHKHVCDIMSAEPMFSRLCVNFAFVTSVNGHVT